MQHVITIENGVTRHPLYRMKEPVNLQIAAGTCGHRGTERWRKKSAGRHYYRTLSVADE